MDAAVAIRPAKRGDVALVLSLIRELADYERLAAEVRASAALLERHVFGERPAAEALIAERGGETAGFAIFFHTFSSFEARPGIWVEDIFVRPAHRRAGLGRALLARVARLALERDCARVEWTVLDWNDDARRFYRSLGARALEEWTTERLEGDALRRLGARV